jgi:hypothetical protein
VREGFVLYAYNLAGEFSVPIARVIMLAGDYRFFEKMGRGDLLLSFVLKHVNKHSPALLSPFGDGWEFFLNTEGVAVHRGDNLDKLPVVDLS